MSNDVVVASDGEVKAGNDNVDASRECVMRFSYFGGMDDLPDGQIALKGGLYIPYLFKGEFLFSYIIISKGKGN